MAKRGHGEGTAFERPDRPGTWRAVFTYTDPVTNEKKRKAFDRTGKSARKEAMAAGREWIKQLEGGLTPDAHKITLSEWINRWLQDYAKPKVRVKSYDKYESCLRLYVKPYLGSVPLVKLKSPDIQRLFNRLLSEGGKEVVKVADGQEIKEKRGLSSLTVRNTRRYLIMAIDQAVKVGLLLKNVAKDTDPPKLIKREIRTLSQEQVKALTEAAKGAGEMPYIAVLLALSTGARLGELFGLKWECVDLNKGAIYIKRSLVTSHGTRGDFQEPKTAKSRRQIPLPANVTKELRKYKKWQEWQQHLLGDKWQNNDLVLASTWGRVVETSNFSSILFKSILEKAGIPRSFKFHDLRHTHATLLLQQGINPKIVQERLGHSTISMTLDTYSHVLPDMQDTAVKALEGMFG